MPALGAGPKRLASHLANATLGNEAGTAYRQEMGRYEDAFRRSLDDPAGFWGEAATAIDWYTQPETILRGNPIRRDVGNHQVLKP